MAGGVLHGLGVDHAPLLGCSRVRWLAASAARFIPDRVTRIALLAPAATLGPMRLPVLLLLRLRPFLPKKEPVAETRKTFRTVFRGRYMPDERYVAQVALGAQHLRYQRPPVFPTCSRTTTYGRSRPQRFCSLPNAMSSTRRAAPWSAPVC